MTPLSYLSWFSGIGGFDAGLDRAGWSCAGACELDPFAREVYAAKRGAPTWFPEDVTKVDPSTIPSATLWTAGFPCQDLSNAGRRAGIVKGARSGLIWTLLDLWDAVAARGGVEWLLIENVPGLLTGRDNETDDGEEEDDGDADGDGSNDAAGDPEGWTLGGPAGDLAWMGLLLGALADRGLRYAWRRLDARWFGLAQRRKRIYILASRRAGDGPGPREVLLEPEGVRRGPPTRRAPWAGAAAGVEGGARCGRVAHAVRARPNLAHREDAATLVTANALEASDGHHGRSSPRGDGNDNLIAYDAAQIMSQQNRARCAPGDPAPTLHAGGTAHVAFHVTQDPISSYDVVPCLGAGNREGCGTAGVAAPNAGVRRLTPLECERLQGFRDGWTCTCGVTPYATATCRCADGPRYRVLGNAVAVPVAAWIGRRLRAVVEERR